MNILTFVGANGCGKSNIVNLISHILRPDSEQEDSYNNKKTFFPYDEKILPEKYCLIYKINNKILVKKKGIIHINLTFDDAPCTQIEPEDEAPSTKVAKFCPFLRDETNFSPDCDKEIKTQFLEYHLNNYFYYDRFENDDIRESLSRIFEHNDLKLFEDNPELMFELCGYELNFNNEFKKTSANMNYWRDVARRRYPFIKINNENLIGKLNHSIRAIFRLYKSYYINNAQEKVLKSIAQKELPLLCFQKVITELFKISVLFDNEAIIELFENYFKDDISKSSGLNLRIPEHRIKFYSEILNALHPIQDKISTLRIWEYDKLKNTINTFIYFEKNISEYTDFIINNFEIIKHYDEKIIRIKPDLMLDSKNYYLPPNKESNKEKQNLYATTNVFSTIFQFNFYKKDSRFSTYTFNSLSTGEQRILKFYADIIGVYDYSKEKKLVTTFIFDEMDLSWHPEWQRNFMYYIIDIFKHFNGHFNLIFTTHSPFILSDLTKDNVVLLHKDKSLHTKIYKNTMQTFGANIHNLFKENFFLNCDYGCTMGNFAKNETQKISKELCSKKITNYNGEQLEQLEKKIHLIGEPLIRTSFLKKIMYTS